MRISDSSSLYPNAGTDAVAGGFGPNRGRGGADGASADGSLQSGGDSPALGASSATLTAAALAQPDVRTARVDALRAQIAGGSYSTDPQAIAAAMLADPQSGLSGE